MVQIPCRLAGQGTDAPDFHRRQPAQELFAVIPSDGIPHTDPAEVGVLLRGTVASLARDFKGSKSSTRERSPIISFLSRSTRPGEEVRAP